MTVCFSKCCVVRELVYPGYVAVDLVHSGAALGSYLRVCLNNWPWFHEVWTAQLLRYRPSGGWTLRLNNSAVAFPNVTRQQCNLVQGHDLGTL